MWYGAMTEELEDLYDEYESIFNDYPDVYIDLEYGETDYGEYVADIKKAIGEKKELPQVVNYIESDW